MTKSFSSLQLSACIVLFGVFLGLTFDPREFVKIQVGGLYTLEWAALAILLSFFAAPLADFWKQFFERKIQSLALTLACLFFILGGLRFLWEWSHPELQAVPFKNALQHALLFVYPAIWLPIGIAFSKRHPTFLSKTVIFFAVFSLWPIPGGNTVTNLSMGSSALVLAYWYFFRALHQSQGLLALGEHPSPTAQAKTLPRYLFPLLIVLFVFLAFYPYWKGLLQGIQRSTFLMTVVAILYLPFFTFSRVKRTWTQSILFSLLGFFIYTAGAVITLHFFYKDYSYFNRIHHFYQGGKGGSFSQGFLQSFKKGENIPDGTGNNPIGGRTRSAMWNNALEEWRRQPLLGTGFFSPMPTRVNLWGIEKPNTLEALEMTPINGVHNSYLTVLARTGIMGALVLLGLIGLILFEAFSLLLRNPENPLDLLLLFTFFFNSLLYAIFNVGFESPHHALITWFFGGCLLAYRRPENALT